ncbi:uncharacterized protein LOC126583139 isoform X1 [Malus sylvestris]|uniref:uncharacterized protein LOC126583139 isoform X1 n=1 Tax=Malus sylvestris TaxID=3752 RepID=UPI0021AC298D|nr:uncharacterized protein LOC126583139 isoform X1 [Malus sylvestris]
MLCANAPQRITEKAPRKKKIKVGKKFPKYVSLKKYGVKESWTKLINLGPQGPERLFPRALCFRRNGEVLVMLLKGGRQLGFETNISKHELVSLDLVSKQMESLEICGPYCSVDSYEESLLLLDKTDAVSL